MSMSILASYVLLGLSLAAPIGPVNAARIEKGIKNGFFHSWIVGIGGMLADATFMVCVYFGLNHFINVPFIQSFLWLFGAFVLVYSGIEGMTKASLFQITESRQKDSLKHCFFTGYLLSISNPMSMLFWLGIYGSIMVKTSQTTTTEEFLLYSSMIFVGLTIWDLLVAGIISGSRRFLTATTLKTIAYLSGFSLIGFGLYFAIHGILTLVKY
ncbi:LysE family translocator [Bacillus sp. JCM 19041]|uniref:LysE family translocator n=1 Tax=Bacillus sp. JCM 19041 TaxID=1460637 RepID=UPI0006CF8676